MTKSLTRRLLLSLDQMGNVLILDGSEDETISSHCWRQRDRGGKWLWWIDRIDGLFLLLTGERDHCRNSFEAQLPEGVN